MDGWALDSHPVFWRGVPGPAAIDMVALLWKTYVAGAVLFTILAASECATIGAWKRVVRPLQRLSGRGRAADE